MMGSDDDANFIEAIVTCEGNLHDPDFSTKFQLIVDKLKSLLSKSKREEILKVRKIEPWNSVRVTISIPKEAAQRLRSLAQHGSHVLRQLGILSVQVEGDQVISLTLAGKNNEPQEVLLNQSSSSAGPSTSSTSNLPSTSFNFTTGIPNVGIQRPNTTASHSHPSQSVLLPSQSSVSSSPARPNLQGVPSGLLNTGSRGFISPNVVAPSGESIPSLPKTGAMSNSRPIQGVPFPFASMTHAVHTLQRNDSFSSTAQINTGGKVSASPVAASVSSFSPTPGLINSNNNLIRSTNRPTTPIIAAQGMTPNGALQGTTPIGTVQGASPVGTIQGAPNTVLLTRGDPIHQTRFVYNNGGGGITPNSNNIIINQSHHIQLPNSLSSLSSLSSSLSSSSSSSSSSTSTTTPASSTPRQSLQVQYVERLTPTPNPPPYPMQQQAPPVQFRQPQIGTQFQHQSQIGVPSIPAVLLQGDKPNSSPLLVNLLQHGENDGSSPTSANTVRLQGPSQETTEDGRTSMPPPPLSLSLSLENPKVKRYQLLQQQRKLKRGLSLETSTGWDGSSPHVPPNLQPPASPRSEPASPMTTQTNDSPFNPNIQQPNPHFFVHPSHGQVRQLTIYQQKPGSIRILNSDQAAVLHQNSQYLNQTGQTSNLQSPSGIRFSQNQFSFHVQQQQSQQQLLIQQQQHQRPSTISHAGSQPILNSTGLIQQSNFQQGHDLNPTIGYQGQIETRYSNPPPPVSSSSVPHGGEIQMQQQVIYQQQRSVPMYHQTAAQPDTRQSSLIHRQPLNLMAHQCLDLQQPPTMQPEQLVQRQPNHIEVANSAPGPKHNHHVLPTQQQSMQLHNREFPQPPTQYQRQNSNVIPQSQQQNQLHPSAGISGDGVGCVQQGVYVANPIPTGSQFQFQTVVSHQSSYTQSQPLQKLPVSATNSCGQQAYLPQQQMVLHQNNPVQSPAPLISSPGVTVVNVNRVIAQSYSQGQPNSFIPLSPALNRQSPPPLVSEDTSSMIAMSTSLTSPSVATTSSTGVRFTPPGVPLNRLISTTYRAIISSHQASEEAKNAGVDGVRRPLPKPHHFSLGKPRLLLNPLTGHLEPNLNDPSGVCGGSASDCEEDDAESRKTGKGKGPRSKNLNRTKGSKEHFVPGGKPLSVLSTHGKPGSFELSRNRTQSATPTPESIAPSSPSAIPASSGEKIKLRLKLEKHEPTKVEISYVKKSEKCGAVTLPASGLDSNNEAPPLMPSSTNPVEQPRVPPLHISIRGKNSAVVVSPRRDDGGGVPFNPTFLVPPPLVSSGGSVNSVNSIDSGLGLGQAKLFSEKKNTKLSKASKGLSSSDSLRPPAYMPAKIKHKPKIKNSMSLDSRPPLLEPMGGIDPIEVKPKVKPKSCRRKSENNISKIILQPPPIPMSRLEIDSHVREEIPLLLSHMDDKKVRIDEPEKTSILCSHPPKLTPLVREEITNTEKVGRLEVLPKTTTTQFSEAVTYPVLKPDAFVAANDTKVLLCEFGSPTKAIPKSSKHSRPVPELVALKPIQFMDSFVLEPTLITVPLSPTTSYPYPELAELDSTPKDTVSANDEIHIPSPTAESLLAMEAEFMKLLPSPSIGVDDLLDGILSTGDETDAEKCAEGLGYTDNEIVLGLPIIPSCKDEQTGAGNSEDSGIDSMDALSEKSPNLGESPIRKESESFPTCELNPCVGGTSDMLSISECPTTEQNEPMIIQSIREQNDSLSVSTVLAFETLPGETELAVFSETDCTTASDIFIPESSITEKSLEVQIPKIDPPESMSPVISESIELLTDNSNQPLESKFAISAESNSVCELAFDPPFFAERPTSVGSSTLQPETESAVGYSNSNSDIPTCDISKASNLNVETTAESNVDEVSESDNSDKASSGNEPVTSSVDEPSVADTDQDVPLDIDKCLVVTADVVPPVDDTTVLPTLPIPKSPSAERGDACEVSFPVMVVCSEFIPSSDESIQTPDEVVPSQNVLDALLKDTNECLISSNEEPQSDIVCREEHSLEIEGTDVLGVIEPLTLQAGNNTPEKIEIVDSLNVTDIEINVKQVANCEPELAGEYIPSSAELAALELSTQRILAFIESDDSQDAEVYDAVVSTNSRPQNVIAEQGNSKLDLDDKQESQIPEVDLEAIPTNIPVITEFKSLDLNMSTIPVSHSEKEVEIIRGQEELKLVNTEIVILDEPSIQDISKDAQEVATSDIVGNDSANNSEKLGVPEPIVEFITLTDDKPTIEQDEHYLRTLNPERAINVPQIGATVEVISEGKHSNEIEIAVTQNDVGAPLQVSNEEVAVVPLENLKSDSSLPELNVVSPVGKREDSNSTAQISSKVMSQQATTTLTSICKNHADLSTIPKSKEKTSLDMRKKSKMRETYPIPAFPNLCHSYSAPSITVPLPDVEILQTTVVSPTAVITHIVGSPFTPISKSLVAGLSSSAFTGAPIGLPVRDSEKSIPKFEAVLNSSRVSKKVELPNTPKPVGNVLPYRAEVKASPVLNIVRPYLVSSETETAATSSAFARKEDIRMCSLRTLDSLEAPQAKKFKKSEVSGGEVSAEICEIGHVPLTTGTGNRATNISPLPTENLEASLILSPKRVVPVSILPRFDSQSPKKQPRYLVQSASISPQLPNLVRPTQPAQGTTRAMHIPSTIDLKPIVKVQPTTSNDETSLPLNSPAQPVPRGRLEAIISALGGKPGQHNPEQSVQRQLLPPPAMSIPGIVNAHGSVINFNRIPGVVGNVIQVSNSTSANKHQNVISIPSGSNSGPNVPTMIIPANLSHHLPAQHTQSSGITVLPSGHKVVPIKLLAIPKSTAPGSSSSQNRASPTIIDLANRSGSPQIITTQRVTSPRPIQTPLNLTNVGGNITLLPIATNSHNQIQKVFVSSPATVVGGNVIQMVVNSGNTGTTTRTTPCTSGNLSAQPTTIRVVRPGGGFVDLKRESSIAALTLSQQSLQELQPEGTLRTVPVTVSSSFVSTRFDPPQNVEQKSDVLVNTEYSSVRTEVLGNQAQTGYEEEDILDEEDYGYEGDIIHDEQDVVVALASSKMEHSNENGICPGFGQQSFEFVGNQMSNFRSLSVTDVSNADIGALDVHGEDQEIIDSFSKQEFPIHESTKLKGEDIEKSSLGDYVDTRSKTNRKINNLEELSIEIPVYVNEAKSGVVTRSTRSSTRVVSVSPDITALTTSRSETPPKLQPPTSMKLTTTRELRSSPKPSPTGSAKLQSPNSIVSAGNHIGDQVQTVTNFGKTIAAKIQSRKRRGSNSSSTSKDENGEDGANKSDLIELNSRPGKRRCSENAAELIKACIGAEDTPKRNTLLIKRLEDAKARELKTKRAIPPSDEVDDVYEVAESARNKTVRTPCDDGSSSRSSSGNRHPLTSRTQHKDDEKEVNTNSRTNHRNPVAGKKGGSLGTDGAVNSGIELEKKDVKPGRKCKPIPKPAPRPNSVKGRATTTLKKEIIEKSVTLPTAEAKNSRRKTRSSALTNDVDGHVGKRR